MIEWTNVREAYGTSGRQTLHQSLVTRIGQMIQDGELAPGMRLSEAALCQQFDVSRTPLREALKVLTSEGYLVWRANRGITVAQIEIDEVRAAFELLVGLERMIGELACERAAAADIAAVETLHVEMVGLRERGARQDYFRLNQAIHAHLAHMSGNPVIEDVYRSIQRRVYRARALSNTSHTRWDESVREHGRMIAALRRRDGASLSRELVAHTETTRDVILLEIPRLALTAKAD